MSKVHILDDNTINKIAAGEVVERPASVVKELVENAIDAKASKIEVEIMAGGTSFIRITDNGTGMSMEDARLAIERHATSKLTEVGDLLSISTLGFRGEALPSIASVSRFSMLTRQASEVLGTEVKLTGGKNLEVNEAGCSIGTTIRVEDLFFNTPARKKFLKTNNTEASKINDFILKLAISNPNIAFRFINNGKQSVQTPGNGNLFDTLRSIYGGAVADALLPVDFADEASGVTIGGYVSKPSCVRSSRSWQTSLVNGRIITSKAIIKAVDNAYHSIIPKAGFPLVVLRIEVPQRTIDVNVHPQKTEMKFEDEGLIFKAVYKSVLDAIRPDGQSLSQVAASIEKPKAVIIPEHQETLKLDTPGYSVRIDTGEIIETPVARPSRYTQGFYSRPADVPSEPERVMESVSADAAEASAAMEQKLPAEGGLSLTPIGQVADCYILAKDSDSLYIVDQHAAHERILYDKFCAMTEAIPSQQLLIHSFIDFDAREAQLIEGNQELFRSLGFGLEASGPMQFRLTEIPADIPDSEAESIIREILMHIGDMHKVSAAELRHSCIAITACKAAIKAGFKLNMRQMEIILEELSVTSRPYTCPHGRPTIISFSRHELDKLFKRTGFNL